LRCALLDSVREQPGGEALLAAAYEGVHLVGGAVRDLLHAEHPRELDVLVEGSIEPLLEALGGEVVTYDRFGTASVSLGDARIDVARARRERYPRPGALPVVEPATVREDLLRRDFTVNAIAVSLTDGETRAAPHAEADLAHAVLRVLHERSFLDDPTRLLRLGRYATRLGFEPEQQTAALARQALAAGALETVSGARIGAELRLALAEPNAPAALAALDELGVLSALHSALRFDESLAREALSLLPADGRSEVLLLAALLLPLAEHPENSPETAMRELLDGLEFAAGDRRRAIATALAAPRLPGPLSGASTPSALRATALGVPVEAIALAAALSDPASPAREAVRRWLGKLRDVRLSITGDDLLAAGVPAGPEIGLRLEAALNRKLDGQLPNGREAELQAALEMGVE
jgi:tRNA nucleotidyltransferase (CCA-adding enzyme)